MNGYLFARSTNLEFLTETTGKYTYKSFDKKTLNAFAKTFISFCMKIGIFQHERTIWLTRIYVKANSNVRVALCVYTCFEMEFFALLKVD